MRIKILILILFTTSNTGIAFGGIPQDTLIIPKSEQNRSLLLDVPVRKLEIDLERAQEVIGQTEQREKAIVAGQQRRVVLPVAQPIIRKPSVETDTLMAKYQHIGCMPRMSFPDTLALTILERYYQPVTTLSPDFPTADSTLLTATTVDNPVAAPSDTIIKPVIPEASAPFSGFTGGDVQKKTNSSIITISLLCGLVLSAGIRFRFGGNLSLALQSFFSYQQARRMLGERRESDRQATLYSNILFAFVAGIYITLLLPFFNIDMPSGNHILPIVFFSVAVSLLYQIKTGIWKILGVVFMVQSFSREYIYNMFLYNGNTGLFIFPLVAIIPYVDGAITPFIIYGVITILGLSYLLRMWRIFQIIHAQDIPVYHFILYLCTLEFLPLLLLVKMCKVLSEKF